MFLHGNAVFLCCMYVYTYVHIQMSLDQYMYVRRDICIHMKKSSLFYYETRILLKGNTVARYLGTVRGCLEARQHISHRIPDPA